MDKDHIITDDLLREIRTHKGSHTKEQLAILGISWPPPSGWKRFITGKLISNENYLRLLAIRNRIRAEDEGNYKDLYDFLG